MRIITTTKDLTQQTNLLVRYFNSIDWNAVGATILTTLGQIILFSLLFWVINRIGKRFIKSAFGSYKTRAKIVASRVDTMRSLTTNIFTYTVLFFYLYAVLTTLGVPVGTLLAGAGVVGVALGLGAQGFVSDVVNGFFILMEAQFDVGDVVTLGSVTGTVISVGLRTTIVKATDGTISYIPNRNISIVSNLSRSQMQALIKLPILPTTDLEALRRVVQTVNQQLTPKVLSITDGPTLLGVTTEADGTFSYQVMMHVKNGQQAAVQRQFLGAYVEALQAAGVTLATRQPQPPTPVA